MLISTLHYPQISKNDYPMKGSPKHIFWYVWGSFFIEKRGIHSCDGGCLLTYIWYIDGGKWRFYN